MYMSLLVLLCVKNSRERPPLEKNGMNNAKKIVLQSVKDCSSACPLHRSPETAKMEEAPRRLTLPQKKKG